MSHVSGVRMIIGLTGKNCAGKGEIANFLKTAGLQYYSLSDVLRDEMRKVDLAITRDNLIAFGTKFRSEHGQGALAQVVLTKLDPEKNYIVDSIRHPVEVAVLRRRADFALLCVTADEKIRFERIRKRGRESDPTTYEEFVRCEKAESDGGDPASQQLDSVIALAEYTIANNGAFENLHEVLRETLRTIANTQPRPDWHVYFMGIAKVTALRSNCLKRKVAAVIVKDKRIISTGYNGTPRGIKNCNEGGCPRCHSLGESGKNLDTCICSHAEENAIVQSAYHGVGIKDATIYSTFSPCLQCTKMIINAGLREVVYQTAYPMESVSLQLLREAGVLVTQVV